MAPSYYRTLAERVAGDWTHVHIHPDRWLCGSDNADPACLSVDIDEPATVHVVGPRGCGKTRAVIDQVLQRPRRRRDANTTSTPLARVLWIAPTEAIAINTGERIRTLLSEPIASPADLHRPGQRSAQLTQYAQIVVATPPTLDALTRSATFPVLVLDGATGIFAGVSTPDGARLAHLKHLLAAARVVVAVDANDGEESPTLKRRSRIDGIDIDTAEPEDDSPTRTALEYYRATSRVRVTVHWRPPVAFTHLHDDSALRQWVKGALAGVGRGPVLVLAPQPLLNPLATLFRELDSRPWYAWWRHAIRILVVSERRLVPDLGKVLAPTKRGRLRAAAAYNGALAFIKSPAMVAKQYDFVFLGIPGLDLADVSGRPCFRRVLVCCQHSPMMTDGEVPAIVRDLAASARGVASKRRQATAEIHYFVR